MITQCKTCNIDIQYTGVKRLKCDECIKETKRKNANDYYHNTLKNNPEVRAYRKQYRDRTKKARSEFRKKWYEDNREHVRDAQRRAMEINAAPKWLTEEQKKEIKDIYLNCPEGYEVDHIIPLNNKSINGLHVSWNLQYLTVKENRAKGNKVMELSNVN